MANRNGREALRGVEVDTFDLMFEVLTSAKWAEWLAAPLVFALVTGNNSIAQQLVGAGAEIWDEMKEIIQAGNQVDATVKNDGREALHGAEVPTCNLMSECSPEQWAGWLKAPLECAAVKGNRGLAQQLVRAGAPIGNALHGAVKGGHGEVVSDLLESGASIAAKGMKDRTPLHVAVFAGETEMVELLLLKGAYIDAFDDKEWTPLSLAAKKGHVGAALALLAAGAEVSLPHLTLKSQAIHTAAGNGHGEVLRALIDHGADVDAGTRGEHTPLHFAAGFNKVEAVLVLVEAGANIESRSQYGCTPLHAAAQNLSRKALLSLLKQGATVDARNSFGQTPLMIAAARAASQGAVEVVDALLRAGADETIVTNTIGTAVEEVQGEGPLVESVERVRELLANAPADRAWRRRGYLVLCRAQPDRVQEKQVISSTHHADTSERTRSCATLATAEPRSCHETVGGSHVNELDGGDWAVVVSKVLWLQEEGIFRTIVGYL